MLIPFQSFAGEPGRLESRIQLAGLDHVRARFGRMSQPDKTQPEVVACSGRRANVPCEILNISTVEAYFLLKDRPLGWAAFRFTSWRKALVSWLLRDGEELPLVEKAKCCDGRH